MAPMVEPLRQLADVWCIDLPGFGQSPAQNFNLPDIITALVASLPSRAHIVGWSLGGALAIEYASCHPERVQSLITLATNPCFVARKDWPTAMAKATNRAFNTGFEGDPATSLKRFCALVAQGGADERSQTKQLRGLAVLPERERVSVWAQALTYLAGTDFRSSLAQLQLPGLHLFAAGDHLVPAGACDATAELNPAQKTCLIDDAGHALHWDQPRQVAARVAEFVASACAQSDSQLDKGRVARSFSKAASSYESAARLQRLVGERLLAKISAPAGRVLDAGSGTGYFLQGLREAAGASQLTALDLASGMLSFARQHHPYADNWFCADLEAMPLANASVDLIYSSLAVQWCEDLTRLARELYRVLAPGGHLYLATLGHGTLQELQTAWQQVDGYVHVNRFLPVELLQQALTQAGFTDIQLEVHSETLYSDNVRQLARELKDLGAHNINAGAPRGLTGRRRLQSLEQAYEPMRTAEGLPATYKVCYLTARKGG
ncbi:malonyl-ACP O-methyltransferase BioC [Gilvimarinus sp. DA14]|nr:malonyl-ACP O-methyltransferase BioC [Gilvimarinus sp. DA14]